MSEENRVSEVRPVSRMRIGVHVRLVLLGAVLFLTGVRGLGSLLAIGSTLNIALLLVRPALRGRSPGTQALFPVFILVAIATPIFVGGAISNFRESKPVGWHFLALVIVGLLTLVSLVRDAHRSRTSVGLLGRECSGGARWPGRLITYSRARTSPTWTGSSNPSVRSHRPAGRCRAS